MIKRIIFITGILFALLGCSGAAPREDSRISLEYVEGYYRVVFNALKGVNSVRLEGVSIVSGEVYYIQEGEYNLTYVYQPTFSFKMEASYKREDRNGGDSDTTSMTRVREVVEIGEDRVIEIEGKRVEIDIRGEAGS